MPSGLVPQSEFDPVAYTNLVVNSAQVVSDNMRADSEIGRDFSIFQPLGY